MGGSFGKLRRIWEKIKGGIKSIWNKGLKPLIVSAAPAVGTAIGSALGGTGGAAVGGMIGGTVSNLFGGNQQKQPIYSSPGGSENMVRLGQVGSYLANRG
jgi:hypothetical protein